MGITTRDKRASIFGYGGEWCISYPMPGTHTQGDRQQVIGLYAGVLISGVVVSSLRVARYYTPMVYEEEDQSGIKRAGYWMFEDGTEILWGTK